jgi:large subunit ribosomal protein L23
LVALKANKFDIRNAVESLFKVSVLKVTTVRMMGKRKRRGRIYGKRPDYKKAYVTIKAGDKIEIAGAPLFEN